MTIVIALLQQRVQFVTELNFPILIYLEEARLMLSVQMFSFIILSVCLIRIPSIVLAALFRELAFGNPADMNEMVAKWNRHYLLICDLVADLNDFLGQSLLLFIGFSFFTSISYSFAILYVVFIKSDVPFPLFYDDIFIVIQNLVCFIFLFSKTIHEID